MVQNAAILNQDTPPSRSPEEARLPVKHPDFWSSKNRPTSTREQATHPILGRNSPASKEIDLPETLRQVLSSRKTPPNHHGHNQKRSTCKNLLAGPKLRAASLQGDKHPNLFKSRPQRRRPATKTCKNLLAGPKPRKASPHGEKHPNLFNTDHSPD